TYVLTPTNNTTAGSLNDGTYAVVIHPTGVHNLTSPSITMGGVDRSYSFYRLYGETNGNSTVDFNDFLSLQNAFGATSASPGFVPGLDSDTNGVIDFNDFLALQNRFGQTAEAPKTPLSTTGTDFGYYEGTWTALPNFATLTPVKTGLTHNFDLSIRKRDTNYAFIWNGAITLALAGTYTFYAASDDGSALLIDGQRVVNNDGVHSYIAASGSLSLSAGTHTLTVQHFQSGGAQQLSVSYQGPGVSKQPIPDVVLSGVIPTNVYVRDYSAVGDGSTNDATAIQAAINAAPDGATLVLDAGKTYKLNTGLTMGRPLSVEGNNATLLLNTSAYPQNETVYYASPLAATAYTWKQTVKAGQTTFNVPVSTDVLLPGDTVFLQLGTDVNDGTQPNWGEVCQIVANTGSTVTVNIAVPYDISQGARSNSIQRITDVAQNVSFRNVAFNYVAGTKPDANLWLERTRNVTISNLSGQFTIMANIVDSQNVTVSDCHGTLNKLASSSGRMVTSWQMDGLNLYNNTATTSADAAIVFLESWSRNVTVSGLTVNWGNAAVSNQDVFHITGNSYDVFADNVTINNAGSVNLVQSGAQPASYRFGSVSVSGAVKSAPLAAIAKLTTGGKTYDASKMQNRTFTVPISANWTDHQVSLCSGVVESVSFTLSSLTGVNTIFVLSSNGAGFQLIGTLAAGKVSNFQQAFGTDYPFDAPTAPDKTLHISTGSSVPAGTVLSVSVNYYPLTSSKPAAKTKRLA
ncbi:MAG: glycoside hydrolase, partial [Phycisphaerales bacterium]|nr:glycoside hydrolase [Phycisphaerales bacterium]